MVVYGGGKSLVGEALKLSQQFGLIVLDGHDLIGVLLLNDELGSLALSVHGIER